jgi:hypothetical protein
MVAYAKYFLLDCFSEHHKEKLCSGDPILVVFQHYRSMLTREKLLKDALSAYREHSKNVQSPTQLTQRNKEGERRNSLKSAFLYWS